MTYNHFQVQKLLKEQGLINQLIHLLKRIDSRVLEKQIDAEIKDNLKIKGSLKIVKGFTPEMLSEKKNIEIDPLKVRKIVNLCLKILRNCCKGNNDNSLLLFKEIETFTKFLSLDTYAE